MEHYLGIFVLCSVLLAACVLCFLFFKVDQAITIMNKMEREYPTVLNDLIDRNVRKSLNSMSESITPTAPMKPNNFKSFTRISKVDLNERA
jgi:hypothetical protein